VCGLRALQRLRRPAPASAGHWAAFTSREVLSQRGYGLGLHPTSACRGPMGPFHARGQVGPRTRVCGAGAGAVSNRATQYCDCRCFLTGATGLEPATSGVTGVTKALRPASSNELICRALFALRWPRSAWLRGSFKRRLGHEWATPCCPVRLQTAGDGLGPQRSPPTGAGGDLLDAGPLPIATLATQPQVLLCPARFDPSSGSSLLRFGLLSAQIAS
jgi:hypothetical protein